MAPAKPAWLKGICLNLLEFFLPRMCLFCGVGVETEADQAICPDCEAQIEWVASPLCPCCGRLLDSGEADRLCGDCQTEPPPFTRARAAALYDKDKEGPVEQAIKRFKFGRQIVFLPLLQSWLKRPACRELAEDANLLLPVPLFPKRLKERGFNQALLLAQAFPEKPINFEVLTRVRHTIPQVGLNLRERRKNVKNAFAVSPAAAVRGKKVLLLDDLFTTGSTVRECARVLRRAGAARVEVLTVARGKHD